MHTLGINKMWPHTHTHRHTSHTPWPRAIIWGRSERGSRGYWNVISLFLEGHQISNTSWPCSSLLPSGSSANEQGRHGKTGPAKRLICRGHASGRLHLIYVWSQKCNKQHIIVWLVLCLSRPNNSEDLEHFVTRWNIFSNSWRACCFVEVRVRESERWVCGKWRVSRLHVLCEIVSVF